jgi:hypothetical protein
MGRGWLSRFAAFGWSACRNTGREVAANERRIISWQIRQRLPEPDAACTTTAPLNAIKWNIEAIRDTNVGFQRKIKMKLLSSIYSQGTILVHLIKNFSLMSNLEADHELGQFREKPEAAF